jgi:homoserine kinase
MTVVTVRVPATTANLGPGFDCLGLALDLWNEATFSLEGNAIRLEINGEGKDRLPVDSKNLVASAAISLFKELNRPSPDGLTIHCTNHIPLGSGMGSSAAAVLSGLLGANALLDFPLTLEEILKLAIKFEGHPDNVTAALYGGLILVANDGDQIITHRYPVAPIDVIIALPQVNLPTKTARAALPAQVSFADAVYNISHTSLVIEALRVGDLQLLAKSMVDRLHQPYRLKLIPGAEECVKAAQRAGAAAVAISGAGPSIAAFSRSNAEDIAQSMVAAFMNAGLTARSFILKTAETGGEVKVKS